MKKMEVSKARSLLLAWYDRHRRDLPWRRTRDPYAIWLSEIMLQQTTVATVTPRWERFLQRWPSMRELANAPLDDVLHEWTGLGYYARARNLHRAAQVIVGEHDATLPRDYQSLLKLPGMGIYTAAAVASIAFGEAVPVVDANVERVLARLHAIKEEARATVTKKRLRELADALLDRQRPGDFNQAMMELGAVICLSKNPRCGECPLEDHCTARAAGNQDYFPVLKKKPPLERIREVAVVLHQGERLLLLRRPRNTSFGGMWEPPRVVCLPEETPHEAAVRAACELTGITPKLSQELLRIKHVVMRRSIELIVLVSDDFSGEPVLAEHEEFRWSLPAEWLELPKSTTQAEVARRLSELFHPDFTLISP